LRDARGALPPGCPRRFAGSRRGGGRNLPGRHSRIATRWPVDRRVHRDRRHREQHRRRGDGRGRPNETRRLASRRSRRTRAGEPRSCRPRPGGRRAVVWPLVELGAGHEPAEVVALVARASSIRHVTCVREFSRSASRGYQGDTRQLERLGLSYGRTAARSRVRISPTACSWSDPRILESGPASAGVLFHHSSKEAARSGTASSRTVTSVRSAPRRIAASLSGSPSENGPGMPGVSLTDR
jgi:hypothetical protein